MKPVVEQIGVDDPRIQYIDDQINDVIIDVNETYKIDPASIAFIIVTQVVRQFAYAGAAETAAYLDAVRREVLSNYEDEQAQQDRFAAGDVLRERLNAVASQVFNELQEARANGRVS